MTADRSADTLESRLSAALSDLRTPGPAPAMLRASVDAIPDALGPSGFVASLRQRARTLALVAMFAAVAVLAAVALNAHPTTAPRPTVGADATPAIFDPTIEGPGIVADPPFMLPLVTGLIALVGLALLVRVLMRWRRTRAWRDIVVGGACVATIAASVGLAIEPGFTWANSYGPAIGYTQVEPLPGVTADRVSVFYSVVGPNQPTAIVFDILNPGPLPITLLGVIEDREPRFGTYRWTAVWLGRHSNQIGFTEDAAMFEPRTVEPGESVVVYLVGRSGPCAYGPDYATAQDVGGYTNRGRQLRVAYSVAGLSASGEITLPMEIVEPVRNGPCP